MPTQIEQETLFMKCKESLEDVVGWKIYIFLPQNLGWRFFILTTVIFTYVMRSVEFFFGWVWPEYYYIEYVCNLFYFFDTVWATLHIFMPNTRKLRHGKKRPLLLLFIDYMSLLPFQMIYNFSIYLQNNYVKQVIQSMRVNVCLRIYQVFYFFGLTRYWVYEMKVYFFVVLIEIVVGILLINHSLACIYYFMLPTSNKTKCMSTDPQNCIIEVELLMFSFFSMTNMQPSFTDPIKESELFVVSVFMLGFLFSYGIIMPVFYFCIINYMNKFSELTSRFRQLQLLLSNVTENKKLQDKTLKYFETVWTYGKGNKPPEIFKLFPLCIQKNIYCDVHWDALTHSEFLSALSFGCKRSLALEMNVDFVLPNTTLLDLREKKKKLYYLESGLIQIMAEENSTSPVLTFSAGTVLGELSLFYQLESKAVVRTAKMCVIHSLNYYNCLKVLLDFPRDMKKLFKIMEYRIEVARAIHQRRNIIYSHFRKDNVQYSSFVQEKNNIQWIKLQYRAVFDLRQALVEEEKNRSERHSTVKRHINDLNTQLEHTSAFLSLIALSNVIVNKYEAVCISMRFPWSMNPQCNFLILWKKLMIASNFVVCILYPFFIGWCPDLPLWFFNLSVLISFLYVVDVFLLFFTAVEINNVLYTKMKSVFSHRLASLSFYADIGAALPLQLYQYFAYKIDGSRSLSLGLLNSLLKCYKLFLLLMEWNHLNTEKPFKRTVIKNIFLMLIAIYWLGTFFKLSGIECIFYDCGDTDWYKIFSSKDSTSHLRDLASLLLSAYLLLDQPYMIFKTSVFYSFAFYFAAYFTIRLCYFLWTSEGLCSFVLEKVQVISYKKLTNFVVEFMHERKIGGLIPKRVDDTMWFQWFYDRGSYITQENRLVNDIPMHLKDELIKMSFFATMQACPLLKMEDERFIMELCRKSERIVLPANSVLVTFGTQMMCLYLIHRGFVQGNSFLSKDVVSNIGKPILFSNGDTFPIMNAFIQVPSIMSARTVTDCELIVLNLEDVLSFMVVHDIFRDVVSALRELDTRPLFLARPGLTIVENAEQMATDSLPEDPDELTYLRYIMRLILLKRAINPRGKGFMRWEVIRICCIVFGLLCWPMFFGCLSKTENKPYLAYMLLIIESTGWVDFYIRMRVAFYNNIGIYVTHPVKTVIHYLSTSFTADLIAFLPHVLIINQVRQNIWEYNLITVGIQVVLRSVGWYRFFGFFNYLSDSKIFSYQLNFIKYVIFFLITLNAFTNLWIYLYLANMAHVVPLLKTHETLPQLYFDFLVVSVQFLTRTKFSLVASVEITLTYVLTFFFPSLLIEITIYGCLMFRFLSNGLTLSTYRYYLKSFLKFLSDEKIEDKYVKEAVNYYEHMWQKVKGTDFKSLFSRFPDILHEDLLYSAYKSTLSMVSCLSKANEAFYRTLSRNVEEVYLKKGSRIAIAKQTNSDIYFVHRGQCEIEKKSIFLCKGSMLGDIKGKGFMIHTIIAKTHVTLLKVSSQILFLAMDNFPLTKINYQKEISQFEDFVKSAYVEALTEDIADEILLMEVSSEKGEEGQGGQPSQQEREMLRARIEEMTKGILNPDSFKSHIFNTVFVLDAFFTSFFVPLILATRSETRITFIIIYLLDALWIMKIIVTTKTAILDPKTGILIYNKKVIFHKYFRRKNGFLLDLISVMPFEILSIIYKRIRGYKDNCFVHFYVLRMLRFVHLYVFFTDHDKKKLSLNFFLKCILIVGKIFLTINFFASLILLFGLSRVSMEDCYERLNLEQWKAIQDSYLCAVSRINFFFF